MTVIVLLLLMFGVTARVNLLALGLFAWVLVPLLAAVQAL